MRQRSVLISGGPVPEPRSVLRHVHFRTLRPQSLDQSRTEGRARGNKGGQIFILDVFVNCKDLTPILPPLKQKTRPNFTKYLYNANEKGHLNKINVSLNHDMYLMDLNLCFLILINVYWQDQGSLLSRHSTGEISQRYKPLAPPDMP